MSKLSLSKMVKATGLAAIIAGFGACSPLEFARMRGKQPVPNLPYIVEPGFKQWNLGVGFWNLANSLPRSTDNQDSVYSLEEEMRDRKERRCWFSEDIAKINLDFYKQGKFTKSRYSEYTNSLKEKAPEIYADYVAKGLIIE